jgi:hypothetical protein
MNRQSRRRLHRATYFIRFSTELPYKRKAINAVIPAKIPARMPTGAAKLPPELELPVIELAVVSLLEAELAVGGDSLVEAEVLVGELGGDSLVEPGVIVGVEVEKLAEAALLKAEMLVVGATAAEEEPAKTASDAGGMLEPAGEQCP